MTVAYFDPPPAADELPAGLASPFDHALPHPLARRAAEAMLAALCRGELGLDPSTLEVAGGGKMFGVLVVRDDRGHVGYLRACSGMLDGRWDVPGFAPPLFDRAVRDRMWPAGQQALRAHDLALAAFDADPDVAEAFAALAAEDRRAADQVAALREAHRDRRARRRADRAALAGEDDRGARHALDQQSRADAAERRAFELARATARAPLAERVAVLEARRAAIEHTRSAESRGLMRQVHDSYIITNARGERRPLRALFEPGEPPGGAGDCAGPKLLGEAYRRGLTPLALAEVWWGAAPATGGRHAGAFYPSCRGKCGRVVPFMLEGLEVAPAPTYGGDEVGPDEPRTVFEDPWLIVVDKPAGLLTIPGRGAALRDCVVARLRRRYPDATGPLVAHRLDLDTSGLLVAAKDERTHAALQALFARREVDKRYVAWLDGRVAADHGVVDLALRVDLDDRPRQIHDPVHGKPAVTAWRVLARGARGTRVELSPRTGRTHQLRVHAAHARGLGAPIVGDRLYGRPSSRDAPRLELHSEHLGFTHPWTGRRVEITSAAPF